MTLPLSRGLRSIQVSHLLTQLHRVESSTFVRFERPKRLSSTSLDSNLVSFLGDNQAVGTGGKAKVLGKVEVPSGMGGVNGIVKYTVVDKPSVPPLISHQCLYSNKLVP